MNWRLWFVQLSGWPVFLAIVALVFVSMVTLSFFMTRISTNRSVAQNAVVAVVAAAVVGFGLLGLLAVLSRW
jgi:hypothetical protein